MLFFDKINDSKYNIRNKSNSVYIGELLQEVDGFFVFYPNDENCGFYPSELLKEISTKIDELNKPWKDHIDKYFRENLPVKTYKF